jgi:ferritin-like metal-binding protein YciE
MAISTVQEKFMHELGDIYDAEHQFLQGQELMLQNANDGTLKQMISQHIGQTRQQINNLEQVFNLMGAKPQRVMCDGAKGIVSEGQKTMREASGSPEIMDLAILGGASKVEHYEIASYRGLITGAQTMGQRDVVNLLQQNLQQEEQTARMIEQTEPQMLQRAMSAQGMTGSTSYNQQTTG